MQMTITSPLGKLVLAVIAAASWVGPGRADESPEDVRRRFLDAYRRPAAELQRLYSRIELQFREFYFVKGNKQYNSGTVHAVVAPTGWRLTRRWTRKDEAHESVSARNPDYEFGASKKGDAYVVTSMSSSAETDRSMFLCPFNEIDLGRTYLDVAQDLSFKPVSFTDAVWQGKPCKAFRITITRRHPQTGQDLTFDKIYYFADQDQWVCRGWTTVRNGEETYVEDRYSYQWVEGFTAPALAHATRWLIHTKPTRVEEGRIGLDVDEFNGRAVALPESELRLTSLGLSEPVVPGRRRSWWNAYLLAAIAFLAVTLALLYARKRLRGVAAS
jgi:hypothetical protein